MQDAVTSDKNKDTLHVDSVEIYINIYSLRNSSEERSSEAIRNFANAPKKICTNKLKTNEGTKHKAKIMPYSFHHTHSVQWDAFQHTDTGDSCCHTDEKCWPDATQMAGNIRPILHGPISITIARCIDNVVSTE
jgi:hypothetical protein